MKYVIKIDAELWVGEGKKSEELKIFNTIKLHSEFMVERLNNALAAKLISVRRLK